MPRLLLILLLLFPAALFASQDEARELLQRGEILPLEQLINKANQHVNGHVIEVELEHKNQGLIYEIELLDEQGQVWKFIFDARTGELLKKEEDD